MEMNNNINHYLSSDFHPLTLSSIHRPETCAPAFQTTHQNSRKKRTKFIRIGNSHSGEHISKPKPSKKPDPTAPKITRPCTECGKKFWSWKALFGHMRCHPERQWRGINPPPNFRRPPEFASSQTEEDSSSVTEEDHEVATCLLMLANGPAAAASDQSPSVTTACTVNQATQEYFDSGRDPDQNLVDGAVGPTLTGLSCGRFECSSCKKVFGSHQALGGHRASHKNVKGCYAITKNDGEDEGCCSGEMVMMMMKDNSNNTNNNGHKCSICFRVFPSGQALGGHMRCHWEKVEEPSRVCGFDLNLVAPLQDEDDASSPYSSGGAALDLRLGL